MRSVTRLIEQIRRQTENDEVSDFVGIQDEEFIQYLNDAQYNLQAQIVHQHPRVFIEEAIIQTVSGQERYDLPSNCFLGNKVHNVEYSASGNDDAGGGNNMMLVGGVIVLLIVVGAVVMMRKGQQTA